MAKHLLQGWHRFKVSTSSAQKAKHCTFAWIFICLSPLAGAQCELVQLANPSFEVGSANQFDGWNPINSATATSDLLAHGNRALQLAGNNTGDWNVSGVWQKQSSAPGDIWEVKASVGHTHANPLVGSNTNAFINIEWRDAADNLIMSYPNADSIGYQSFTVLTQASPRGSLQEILLNSNPAPAGTASINLFIGFLQSPESEPGAAIVDSVYLREKTGVQLEDIQWNDFSGGKTIEFGGQRWRIKGPGVFGPGGNSFSDSSSSVWKDAAGKLHMAIREEAGEWYSSEIASENVLGYGDYRFTVEGDLSGWANNVVFGFFHWQYNGCYNAANLWNLNGELDVELTRWNDPATPNSLFVVQPHQIPGNKLSYETSYSAGEEITTFAYRWLSDRVEFRAWKGDARSEAVSPQVNSWVYTGAYIPREDIARIHLNFWQFNGPPNNGQDHQIVISNFVFQPEGLPEYVVPLLAPLGLILLLNILGTVYFFWGRRP
ncbi:MAG: hypothetical protein EX270_11715 [Pseudomonadales bacterium]|nr:MAG: hypothetical protein EX270_11715 [Pseudomonadales bacterium]